MNKNWCEKHGCEKTVWNKDPQYNAGGRWVCPKCKKTASDKYVSSEKGKVSRARYKATKAGREINIRYRKSEKGKRKLAEYKDSDKFRIARAAYAAKRIATSEGRIKRQANHAVAYAVQKGDLVLANICSVCGIGNRTVFHHDSYVRENWLDVRELCTTCHVAWHKANNAIMPG